MTPTPTPEEKQRIKELLVYDAAEGTLKFSGKEYSAVIDLGTNKKDSLVTDVCDRRFNAADICWFLHYRQWPTHGVVMSDKSPSGRLNLQLSNLRRRRKPEYVKKGRAVWVPRDLLSAAIDALFDGGYPGTAGELEELMAKETKR